MRIRISARTLREFLSSAIIYLLIVLGLIFMLTPVIWLLSTSLKSRSEMFTFPLHLIPGEFVWDNYVKIWKVIPFGAYVKNSVVIAFYTTVVALLFSTLAAYSLSRFRFRRRTGFLQCMLVAQMFPAVLLIIPMFIYVKKLGLLGTFSGLMLTYLTFLLPFSTWALTNFFDNIPVDLEEAALIDGCSRLGAMVRVTLPVSLPGLIAVSTYCFLTSWNEFLFAQTFMGAQEKWTIPVGLAALTSQFALDWGLLTAGGIISLVPAILVMLFLQRYLIAGLMAGAIKE
ncbi:binding-protein-dependent transport systems inner membrane component [Candidatus Vecturithrix granuli]|uniref:Binding-protein-dependent transport systems inner membrane component n=1 Tax=Vecturithrix granuli TaxID=1499967 RepID=A0A081BTZ4_VECG1|nr:binding-protein-dependent transport systems inner membrane component [Candidatus Vecturithrix granuli]